MTNVRPDLAGFDIVDSRGADAESLADCTVSEHARRYQLPNDRNLRLGEFGNPVFRSTSGPVAKQAAGVPDVFRWSDVFQIRQAIVRLVAVLVVYLMPGRAVTKEGSGDETMHVAGKPADTGAQVFTVAQAEFEEASRFRARSRRVASDPAERRDGVVNRSLRHRTPFFGFKFFKGKLLIGHCGNLLERFQLWQERLEESHFFGPFAHNITNYEVATS